MTKQQDVSVFEVKDFALAATAKGLRAEKLCEHMIRIHISCIDDKFLGGLRHEAQEVIDLD